MGSRIGAMGAGVGQRVGAGACVARGGDGAAETPGRGRSAWIDPALQFDLLYEQESELVSRTIRGIVHSEVDVEDLVQECFFRVYRARNRYRPDAPPGAWVHRIAVNTALSHLRRRRGDHELPLEIEIPMTDPDLVQAETRVALEAAMAGLSPKVREALRLRHLEDRPRDEIALTLGVPSGTVASRVARGMEMLRSRL